jgi:pilus assembly protein CpaB
MRGIALEVEDAVGKTRLVYPGAYVDVIVTVRDPNGLGPASYTAVQRARVLTLDATRRQRGEDGEGSVTGGSDKTCVTLEVTPQEAEILAMARNEGDLDLALRNGTDTERVTTTGTRPAMLGPQPAAVPALATGDGALPPMQAASMTAPPVASASATDTSSRDVERSARSPRSRRTRSQIEIAPARGRDASSSSTIETYRAQ